MMVRKTAKFLIVFLGLWSVLGAFSPYFGIGLFFPLDLQNSINLNNLTEARMTVVRSACLMAVVTFAINYFRKKRPASSVAAIVVIIYYLLFFEMLNFIVIDSYPLRIPLLIFFAVTSVVLHIEYFKQNSTIFSD